MSWESHTFAASLYLQERLTFLYAMKKKTFLTIVACVMTAMTGMAQNGYCLTYDDFKADRWVHVDTLYLKKRKAASHFDARITSGDKATDKMIYKKAFVVMLGDSLYVNGDKVQHLGNRFKAGYASAFRYDKKYLAVVGYRNDGQYSSVSLASLMFGAIGGMVAAIGTHASIERSNAICYFVTDGTDGKRMELKPMDDSFMRIALLKNETLREKYFSVENKKERESAVHVLQILDEAGLIQ